MSFTDDFQTYKARVLKMQNTLNELTEEATKNALIMPFFSLLGYDVFDVNEFIPEYVCDVATKKGEKIDYAVLHDGEPIILIEAKRAGMKLQKQQQGQLFRYFSTNRCRIAILTNGIFYQIFSDINSPNVMDDDPFISFNILEDDPAIFIPSLKQFRKSEFNIKDIVSKAVYLKYAKVVEKTLEQDLISPSDELVKYYLSRPEIKTGNRITAQMIEKYREITLMSLRKILGVTILSEEISMQNSVQDKPAPVSMEIKTESLLPQCCSDIISYMKNNFSEIDFKYELKDKIHILYISTANNLTWRIRLSSIKQNHYDIKNYSSNKMVLFYEVPQLKEILQ